MHGYALFVENLIRGLLITYRNGVAVRISPKRKVTRIYRAHFNNKSIKMKMGNYPDMKISAVMAAAEKLT